MADPKDAHEPGERSSRDGAPEGKEREEAKEKDSDERARTFRRFGDSLLSNLIGDSSAAIRRGQGLVTGVAQDTKEELVRMISAEVRGFLDKMDAADLVQEIVSGLVIEMKTEIRFRRADDGKLEPHFEHGETKVSDTKDGKSDKKSEKSDRSEKSDKPEKSERAKDKPEPDKGE